MTPKPETETDAHTHLAKEEDKQAEMDLTNTTLFVGGLDPNVNDMVLMTTFAAFGTLNPTPYTLDPKP